MVQSTRDACITFLSDEVRYEKFVSLLNLEFFFHSAQRKVLRLLFEMKHVLNLKKVSAQNKGFHLIDCFIDWNLPRPISTRVSKENCILIHVYTTVFSMNSPALLLRDFLPSETFELIQASIRLSINTTLPTFPFFRQVFLFTGLHV